MLRLTVIYILSRNYFSKKDDLFRLRIDKQQTPSSNALPSIATDGGKLKHVGSTDRILLAKKRKEEKKLRNLTLEREKAMSVFIRIFHFTKSDTSAFHGHCYC